MLTRFLARQEMVFFTALPRADVRLGTLWWVLVVLRSTLPALLAVATGAVVAAVEDGRPLTASLTALGVVFVLTQVVTPLHQTVGENLGLRVSAWLYDRLTDACVRPAGIGHLEDPELAADMAMAREFDNGVAGPPMEVALPFIAVGLVDFGAGVASALVLFGLSWWAPLLLGGAWFGTHWLLRESAVWRDRNTDEVRDASKHADYAYRMAVDPPSAKELRMFGLADWTVDRFTARRQRLHELQAAATRLRERPLALSLATVVVANLVVLRLPRAPALRQRPVARPRGGVRPGRRGHEPAGLRRAELGARRCRRPDRRGAAAGDGRRARRRPPAGGRPAGGRSAGARDPVPRRRLRLPAQRPAGLRGPRPDHPGRPVVGDRRAERCRQDHPRQAAVPPLRPRHGRHRGGRCRTCATST